MLFRDRPLLPDGLDEDLYVERPRLEAGILAPLCAGRNVLVLGEPGAGKTTLLHRIAGALERADRPAVLVNGSLADDASEVLELVDTALEERLPRESPPVPVDEGPASSRLLRRARRLERKRLATIIVDDLADPDSCFDLFGRLRDELWRLGHSWAVAVRPRDSAALRTPPADAFWARVVEIPPLSQEETDRLLLGGLTGEEYMTLDADQPISGVHPRYVIHWAQDMLEPVEHQDGRRLEPQWHFERASELGRSEAMAVAELQALDRPVSAHDPELLERLGWSRPYAQRILSNLEEHELVRSIPERRDKPGRPRKLYELNPSPTRA